MGAVEIRWMSLFADVPSDRMDDARRYWSAITAAAPGEPTGDDGAYLPLVPDGSDPHVWLQRVDRAGGGWHLDLHVPDVAAAADEARSIGAQPVREARDLAVLASPGGQPFCLVREDAEQERRRARPARWPGEHASLLDQICLDIPADAFDREVDFWGELTTWWPLPKQADEFLRLDVPLAFPLRMLLQRLGPDDSGGMRAHADLSADAREPEVERHQACGGEIVRVAEHWTTLRDPVGLVYCVTDRHPDLD
jgi:hypothetical protein